MDLKRGKTNFPIGFPPIIPQYIRRIFMQADSHIEDLVFQNETLVVYRARASDGSALALIRLIYDDETLALLKADRFHNALKELQSLQHPSLRSVIAGGLDPIDSYPWIATPWQDGQSLSHRISQKSLLTKPEIERIKSQGSALIEALGPLAGTISFTPTSIITSGTPPDHLTDSFSVDYHEWFSAFAQDTHPSTLSASYQKLADLLAKLRPHSELVPASVYSDLGPTSTQTAIAANHTPSTQAPVPPPTSSPTVSSSFPKKILLLASILIIGTAASVWQLSQRDTPKTAALTSEKVAPASTALPKKADRSERPFDFKIPKIQADNSSKVTAHLNQWVSVRGKVSKVDSANRLILENSTVKAKLADQLPRIESNGLIGHPIVITGWLNDQNLLEVTDLSELDVTYAKKNLYGIADLLPVRSMPGETITFKAKVTSFKKSDSGKTFYLHFHENPASLRIQILKSRLSKKFDLAFLKSLVGKRAHFTGKVSVRKSRSGEISTSLLISKQSQIKIVK